MNWAIGIDMYTLMCIKLMTNKNLLHKKINKIKFKNSKKKTNPKKNKNKKTWQIPHERIVKEPKNTYGAMVIKWLTVKSRLSYIKQWENKENKRMDTKGGKGGGVNWEIGIDVYTPAALRF